MLSSKTDGNLHTTSYTYTHRNEKSGASYPDSTSESWTYDADGNALNHTDANGSTVANIYDNADRQTGINYPTGTDTTFSYDNANRRTGMIDRTGTTTWSFDNANRLTQIASPAGTVGYGYDNANRRTGMTLTGTGSWTYAYDNADRLSQVTTPYTENSYYYYDNADRLTQLNAGNSSITTYTYDNANRTTEVQHQTSGHATLGDYQYQYDGASNVTQRTDNDGSITTFGYDGANQLTSEARTVTGAYSIGYTYDHNGNRLTKVQGGVTDTYTYDNHDKLLSTSSKSYTYDYNGNVKTVVVGGVTTTLTYDYDNQVTGLSGGSASDSFVYNGLGLRVSKTDATGTHAFVTDGSDVASPVLSDGSAVYTPGLSERRSGASKFYHPDALGSTRGITNSSQTATDSLLYDAFGMTMARTGSTPTPFGFVGSADYQTDTDTGLMLLGHRYYDPSIGRFISQDPAKDGSNWYEYVGNSPTGRTDPKGLFAVALLGLLAIPGVGEAVGIGIGIVALGGGLYLLAKTINDGPWYRGAPPGQDPTWTRPGGGYGGDLNTNPEGTIVYPGKGLSINNKPGRLPRSLGVPWPIGDVPPGLVILPGKNGHAELAPEHEMPIGDFEKLLPPFGENPLPGFPPEPTVGQETGLEPMDSPKK